MVFLDFEVCALNLMMKVLKSQEPERFLLTKSELEATKVRRREKP